MKQLIVLTAILPLMLIFMAQFTLEQRNNYAINMLQQQVYTAKEEAKARGCFSPDIVDRLKSGISAGLGIPEMEIVVEATETVQYRINYYDPWGERGLIHYKVSVPLEKVMAGGGLLGIPQERNRAVYTVEGTTASERLPE
ncbi:hypothetical protein MASR2M70_05220 [Bacillota bacterium]